MLGSASSRTSRIKLSTPSGRPSLALDTEAERLRLSHVTLRERLAVLARSRMPRGRGAGTSSFVTAPWPAVASPRSARTGVAMGPVAGRACRGARRALRRRARSIRAQPQRPSFRTAQAAGASGRRVVARGPDGAPVRAARRRPQAGRRALRLEQEDAPSRARSTVRARTTWTSRCAGRLGAAQRRGHRVSGWCRSRRRLGAAGGRGPRVRVRRDRVVDRRGARCPCPQLGEARRVGATPQRMPSRRLGLVRAM